ncbi:MAG: hypothetical protein HUU01_14180 [Saprospiraceae bacterium]|nr:hypothetical protein [Saprospiraceae bacterium]
MKKEELQQLNFKDFLPVVYEDIEPYLIAELNRLRAELILLPEHTSEETLLSIFENSVKNLNRIDQDENIESGIDTEEREGLCEALSAMGTIVGLEEDGEYLDEWREW